MFMALLDMMAFEWKGQKKLARLVINDYIGLPCYLIFILCPLLTILQNMIACPVKTAEV
jgi:hypothetical protein